jgi:predicted CxxxxCH...CXXCH cytochrome family protein
MSHLNSRTLTRALGALVAGLAALFATPASAQLTTIGDGATPAAAPLCPGGGAVIADYFTASTSAANDGIKRVHVGISPPGAYQTLSKVEVKDNAGSVIYGGIAPSGDQFDVYLAPTITLTGTATQYRIDVTPKSRAEMSLLKIPGAITVRVLDVAVWKNRTVSDPTAAAITVDNVPPVDVGWASMAATTNRVSLAWNAPVDAQQVLVLRSTSKPVTDAPPQGADIAAYPVGTNLPNGSTVRFSSALAPWTLTDTNANGIVNGTNYFYKAFVRDSCGNWSAGEAVGPILAGSVIEGDPLANSLKPMVGLLNPIAGVVTSPFKVQVRVFSPKNGATVQPIVGAPTLAWRRSDGTTGSVNLAQNPAYGSATDSGVFEPSAAGTGLALTAGAYTIQASATNASGTVQSGVVAITVTAGRGDGNLLVRDNSSQLCNDCHAIPTHSSESTTNGYGSWFTGCRSCHQPHGTTNASLVGTDITPPAVAGQFPPTKTYFSTRTGFDPAAGATNTATISAGTYANGDRTGPCQVCHTRTQFYTRVGGAGNGGPGNHYTTTCTTCHAHQNGFGASCTSCHGTAGRVGIAGADSLVAVAPPKDTSGNLVTTARGVGVHQAHVNQNTWATNPIPCSECHPIPNTHNGVVDIAWGPLTETSYDWKGGAGPAPTWNGTSCSNTYCHGNFKSGNNAAAPVWTSAGSVVCGSCHGIPPDPTGVHAGVTTSCAGCHPAGYSSTTVNKATHMNGALEAAGCNGCHGSTTRTSAVVALIPSFTDSYVQVGPPKDHLGNLVTTARGVGAHDNHVNNGTGLGVPVSCETCHGALPTDSSHQAQPTYVVPAMNWSGTSCATSCHGSVQVGGLKSAPVWTTVDGTQKQCNSCHGLPPPVTDGGGHPPNATCQSCHSGYTSSTVTRMTHVDGNLTVNTTTGCARCHGNLQDAVAAGNVNTAPGLPGTFDAHGNASTVTSAAGVGAHRGHLLPATANAFTCTQCHPNPDYASVVHADGVPAVPFNLVAKTQLPGDPTVPAPSYGSNTCASTYCHGNFQGGKNATPTWAAASITPMTCSSCHGAPPVPAAAAGGVPASYHPNNPNCQSCHTGYTSSTVTKSTHVDGVLNVKTATGCARCHGSLQDGVAATSVNVAPGMPGTYDAEGNDSTVTSNAGVGAHLAHLAPRWFNGNIACTECHPSYSDKLHANNQPAVVFSPTSLATTVIAGDTIKPAPVYAGGGGTCSNTLCHGRFTGGTSAAPVWAQAGYNGKSMTCTSCHGNPPLTALNGRSHPNNTDCGNVNCHGTGYSNTNVTGPALLTHINGVVNYTVQTCTSCHGSTSTHPSVANADPNQLASPPLDANGLSSVTKVGAHLAHVNNGRNQWERPYACMECHNGSVPTQPLHADGVVTIDPAHFGTIAKTGGLSPTYSGPGGTCANTYCHGNFQGGANASPTWIGGATTCTSCHGNPPVPAPASGNVQVSYHPNNPTCQSCHTGYTRTGPTTGTVTQSTHANGTVERLATTGCAQCHGKLGTNAVAATSIDAAPGVGTGYFDAQGNASLATTVAGVGAHRAHLVPRWYNGFIACTECHPSYADRTHAQGVATVVFSPTSLATTALAGDNIKPAPTYTAGGGACQNTLCHGRFSGGTSAAPVWAAANYLGTSMTCTSCHGNPPATAPNGRIHPNNTDCGNVNCHGAGYSNTNVTGAALLTHINGVVDLAAQTCTSCHGSTTLHVSVSGADALQTAAPPLDATGASSGGTKIGAHVAHSNRNTTANPIRCDECHRGEVPSTPLHANGSTTIDPAHFGTVTNSGLSAPSYTAPNCATTYCHGNFNGGANATMSWLATGTNCTSCHGNPPVPAVAAGQVPASYHPNNTNCGQCHTGYSRTGATTGTVTPGTHVNGLIERTTTTGCAQCHGKLGTAGVANNSTDAAPGVASASFDTQGNPSTAKNTLGVGAHAAHLVAGGLKTVALACADCHPTYAAGDRTHANGQTGFQWGALATSGGRTAAAITYSAGTCGNTYCHSGPTTWDVNYLGTETTPTWTLGKSQTVCGSCHKIAPTSSGHTGITGTTQCSDCHPGGYSCTPNTIATCSVGPNNPNHMNGQLDGGISNGQQDCNGCHAPLKVAAANATHAHVISSTAAPANATSYGTTTSQATCTQCHVDHDLFNATPASNLRTSATVANPTATNTDFSGTTGVCVTCHSTGGFTKKGGGTTATINGTSFGSAKHNYAVASTFTRGGTFNGNCSKCHGDPTNPTYNQKFALHASGQDAMLDPLGGSSSATGADEEAFCYRCHSESTDPFGKTVTANDYYGVVTNMAGGATNVYKTFQETYGHKPQNYSSIHKAVETGADYANRHVECGDCHDPHGARAGLHTQGSGAAAMALFGADAVDPNYPASSLNWTAPPSFATGTIDPAGATSLEAYVCMKCHSSYNTAINANPATAPTGSWAGATPSGAPYFTNQAMEFNPGNKSGHPVMAALPANNTTAVGSVQTTAARLQGGWTPGKTMTCTDCHGEDAAAPATQGPHGSAAKFMLTGTNRLWPYQSDGATLWSLTNYTTGTAPNSLFCLNCHTVKPASGANTFHTNVGAGQHTSYGTGNNAVYCVSCHIVVPHGGKVARLITTAPVAASSSAWTTTATIVPTNVPAAYKIANSGPTGTPVVWYPIAKITRPNSATTPRFQATCNNDHTSAADAW